MNKLTIRWFATLALSAAALAGCGDRTEARPVPEAKSAIGPARGVLRPDPVAPQAPAVVCPIPATVAASPLAGGANGTSVKAARPVVKEDAKLSVRRLVIAEGVSNREPKGAGTSFQASEADRIYAFVELENEEKVDSEVTVTFIPPGGKAAIGDVTLDVGPHARWRTWAYTRGARQAGTWTAVVRSMSGKVLAKAPFEITK